MGLKQSVVIVNQFTFKTANGGTRGGTPGDYVLRYMGRMGATEGITPIRQYDNEKYIERYMAREAAVDRAMGVDSDILDIDGLKSDFRKIQGQGGVAFGYDTVSLSHKKLREASKDIQRNFDNGKTVLKTVISFDEAYLRSHNIVDPSFQFQQDGDYRGNIDQLKLRLAIMYGLKSLSRHYDDLQYVGVIQVDTKHVHCHLAMVDRGKGSIMPDGTQRGKLTYKEKEDLRRGINTYLDKYQKVKALSSSYESDKQNTISFVKRYTNRAIEERGFSQLLLACLPENKNLWRANSNAKEMQKANCLVREYVEQLLALPNSGFDEAIAKVDDYAKYRQSSENLTGADFRRLQSQGEKRIIEEGMNAVYSVLRQIPDDEFNTRTSLLTAMSLPREDLANYLGTNASPSDIPAGAKQAMEFSYKLRSYKSRLDHHKEQYHKFHEAVTAYQQEANQNPASQPLLDYFQLEERYNEMLMAKYQHFLKFIPPEDNYMDDLDELLHKQHRVRNLNNMLSDSSFSRMSSDNAEAYGMRVYNESNGASLATGDTSIIQGRLDRAMTDFEQFRDDYMIRLNEYGLTMDYGLVQSLEEPRSEDYDGKPNGELLYQNALTAFNEQKRSSINHSISYEFDEVKALDIHHMLYDFPYDLNVSIENADAFVEMADERYNAFQAAKQYLIQSGQSDTIENLPESDIELQHSIATRFRSEPEIEINMHKVKELQSSRQIPKNKLRGTRTVRLDYDFYVHQEEDIKRLMQDTISSLQFE